RAGHDAFHQPLLGNPVHAANFHGVARTAGKVEGQVAWVLVLVVAIAKALKERIRRDPAYDADACDRLSALNARYRVFQRANLTHVRTPNFCNVAIATGCLQFSSNMRLAMTSPVSPWMPARGAKYCLTAVTATSGKAAMRCASASAVSSAVPSSHRKSARPIRWASTPSSGSLPQVKRLAATGPRRATSVSRPHGGIQPICTSGKCQRQPRLLTTTSQEAEKTKPPPRANPSTAAITGLFNWLIERQKSPVSASCWHMPRRSIVASSFRSLPAQKPGALPV